MTLDEPVPISALAAQRLSSRDVSRLLIAASAIRVFQGSCVDVEREVHEAAEAIETEAARSILAAMADWVGCRTSGLPDPRPTHRELAKRILRAAHVPVNEAARPA